MNLVCLDTHILIWGVKKQATLGQDSMITKAENFLDWLDKEKIKAMVPSIVVAELLLPVPSAEQSKLIGEIQKNFIVPPFDILAAQAFARIWQAKEKEGVIDKLKNNLDRKNIAAYLKVDCQIVAIGVANHADCIYSYDDDIKKFAKDFINVEEMPDIGRQSDLF